MSAPRWIDKLKGWMQRESDVAKTAVPSETIVPSNTSETPIASAPISSSVAKPKRAPTPVIPTINSRALADFGMKQVALIGTQLVQFAEKSKLKATPGLEHDLSLILTGYVMVVASMQAHHGIASQEAQRITRTGLKGVLLSVLRKSYAKANTEEAKLGANMVVYVDELLDGADALIASLVEGLKASTPTFNELSVRLAAPFNTDASAFEKHLADQFARVSEQIARVPKD